MKVEPIHDDSSHYEVSLTGGQALAAFILMLGSLAASFGFGLMLGRGGDGDRLVVRREPSIISEASPEKRPSSRIVELGVTSPPPSPVTETIDPLSPSILEESVSARGSGEPSAGGAPALPGTMRPVPSEVAPPGAPFYAQVISTGDVKAAEALAARLIERGYKTAWVERVTSDRGMTYRVRVKFATEAAARQAVEPLREITKGEVWVTR